MCFPLCLIGATVAGSLAVFFAVLRRAPEAYEDEHGLQIICDHRAHGVPPRSKRSSTEYRPSLTPLFQLSRTTGNARRISARAAKRKHEFQHPMPSFAAKTAPRSVPSFSR